MKDLIKKDKIFFPKKLILILIAVVIFVLSAFFGIYFLLKHEQAQSKNLTKLNAQINYLEEKLNQSAEYYNYKMDYSDTSYNYLAIGNSITYLNYWGHGGCSTQV
ncbi:MAG: hypothetical protein K6C94_03175, partial [Candidatus Gastranaerophilales bacterium]|nr:hypothetical protein [Candidatus Gastranaerophilales bacterium]